VLDANENQEIQFLSDQVGKSTNLAKICFWLIENKFTVLIAACDTFRAINHARDSVIDMVLVDTAGMMQDNEPLMRALSKIISVRMK
jgi:signal recognition particle receptor subunit alpha